MAELTRQLAYTPIPAARINEYATEIERIGAGVFASLTNTSRPRFLLYRSTGLVVSTGTDTIVPWQLVFSDPRGMWDPGNPTIVTVRDAGDWLMFAQERWAASATGSRAGKILRNGTDPSLNAQSSAKLPGQADGEGTTVGLTASVRLDVGDLLRLNCWHSQGTNQTMQVDFGGVFFAGIWGGP